MDEIGSSIFFIQRLGTRIFRSLCFCKGQGCGNFLHKQPKDASQHEMLRRRNTDNVRRRIIAALLFCRQTMTSRLRRSYLLLSFNPTLAAARHRVGLAKFTRLPHSPRLPLCGIAWGLQDRRGYAAFFLAVRHRVGLTKWTRLLHSFFMALRLPGLRGSAAFRCVVLLQKKPQAFA